MTWLLVKLIVVGIFLVTFLRRPTLVWGVGLLTVTTAVLLDTILGTFGREAMLADLGFFFYVLSGGLFGGATIWIWGVLRPMTIPETAVPPTPARSTPLPPPRTSPPPDGNAFDRQMLLEQIRQRFGREDIFDLMFDLEINETDVASLQQELKQLIINIMDVAEERGQTAALALAIERILTPAPPQNLPRLEKITVSSPPTILRQYLLAHYNLEQLAHMAQTLDLDWEQLGSGSKKEKVRAFLLHLYRRNRIEQLIDLMKQLEPA